MSSGLLNTVRNVCSSNSPAMPTGIVARMIIQASFWSVSCSSHRRVPGAGAMACQTEAKKARMIRTQSRQKKRIMAAAVATCSPTMYARYGDSALETSRSCAHCPPMSAGISTAWPRLDTGKSSVIPCSRPTTPASA